MMLSLFEMWGYFGLAKKKRKGLSKKNGKYLKAGYNTTWTKDRWLSHPIARDGKWIYFENPKKKKNENLDGT